MCLLQIYYPVRQWKKFENRLMFGEVMGKSLLSWFLTHSVVEDRHMTDTDIHIYCTDTRRHSIYRAIRARAVKTQTKPRFISKQLGLPVTTLPCHVIIIRCSMILDFLFSMNIGACLFVHVLGLSVTRSCCPRYPFCISIVSRGMFIYCSSTLCATSWLGWLLLLTLCGLLKVVERNSLYH